MLKIIKDLGSNFMSGGESKNQPESNKHNAMGKNKHVPKTNFVVRRKDVVEELANLTTKYPYSRPVFIGLKSNDELQMCLTHAERPIILPKRSTLPRFAGYAECTNAGKSLFNEDQAAAVEFSLGLARDSSNDLSLTSLDKLEIFGVFDGHAGPDVAVTVSHELPHRVKERIAAVAVDIKMALYNKVVEDLTPQTINAPVVSGPVKRKPTVDRLVIGALEAAFQDMDSNLMVDESQYRVKGGCASLVALFYANKLYVANAGDCRAVMSVAGKATAMSTDFTPEFERRRLQNIAEHFPDLLGDEFCSTQFTQRITRKDVGTEMLYRDSNMEGWAYRTITPADLRFPMILGDGRRSRLLCTIGLTRGLGDHNLQVFDSCIKIKPFLSCIPEVKVYDFTSCAGSLTPDDVLIMGSDGLWDVITSVEAADLVAKLLSSLPTSDNTRYISAAQGLVTHARGVLKQNKRDVWVLKDSTDYASHDDVTCFVVPLLAPSADVSAAAANLSEVTEKNSHQGCEENHGGATASAINVDDCHSEATQGEKDQSTITEEVAQHQHVTRAVEGGQSGAVVETGTVVKETSAVTTETNAVAKETHDVAKETDNVAKGTNAVAKETHNVAKEMEDVAKGTNAVATETNAVAKETDAVAKETDAVAKETDTDNVRVLRKDESATSSESYSTHF